MKDSLEMRIQKSLIAHARDELAKGVLNASKPHASEEARERAHDDLFKIAAHYHELFVAMTPLVREATGDRFPTNLPVQWLLDAPRVERADAFTAAATELGVFLLVNCEPE